MAKYSDEQFIVDFISAPQARELAEKANTKKLHPKTRLELEDIWEKINKAYEIGECCVKVDGEITAQAIEFLKSKGYTIEYASVPSISGYAEKIIATKISY